MKSEESDTLAPASPFPFPGCWLEIICTDRTRYQGRMASMDAERRCVTLVEVYHFGTEGRMMLGTVAAKVAKGELPPGEERTFFEQYIHCQRVVAKAPNAPTLAASAGSSTGVSTSMGMNTHSLNAPSASTLLGASRNTFPSTVVDAKHLVPSKRAKKEPRKVRGEVEKGRVGSSSRPSSKHSARSSEKRKHSSDSREEESNKEQEEAKHRKKIVAPTPSTLLLSSPRSHSSQSIDASMKLRDYGSGWGNGRYEISPIRRSKDDDEDHEDGGGGNDFGSKHHPHYFIAQMQDHRQGERRAVGVLINQHAVGNLVHPAYMAFSFQLLPAHYELEVGEIWEVPCYSWISPSRLTYHQYLPSAEHRTLEKFIKEVCGGATPWLSDNEINAEAVASEKGMVRIRKPEEKIIPAKVSFCGSTVNSAGWVRKWVEVKASEFLPIPVRIFANQFTSRRGKRIYSLHVGDEVQVKAIRLDPGCLVGPSFVLPRIFYRPNTPPFHPYITESKVKPSSRASTRVMRAEEGDYLPVWVFDE